MGDMMKNRNTF